MCIARAFTMLVVVINVIVGASQGNFHIPDDSAVAI